MNPINKAYVLNQCQLLKAYTSPTDINLIISCMASLIPTTGCKLVNSAAATEINAPSKPIMKSPYLYAIGPEKPIFSSATRCPHRQRNQNRRHSDRPQEALEPYLPSNLDQLRVLGQRIVTPSFFHCRRILRAIWTHMTRKLISVKICQESPASRISTPVYICSDSDASSAIWRPERLLRPAIPSS